jgi:hypothetical protein
MDRQFKHNQRAVAKNELNNELKTLLMLGYWFAPIKAHIEKINLTLNSGNPANLPVELDHLKFQIDELKKLELTPLSYDLYLKSYYLIHNIVGYYEYSNGILNTLGLLQLKSKANNLNQQSEQINQLVKEFLDIQNTKTSEFKKLY